MVGTLRFAHPTNPSLRGAERRSNPSFRGCMDCFASLAMTTCLPPHQLIGKIPDGLAVDRCPVPLAHGLEIRTALAVWRAHLETAGVQEVRGGGEHIGD